MTSHVNRHQPFLLSKIMCLLLGSLLALPSISQTTTTQIREPSENPKPIGGISVALRIVGCAAVPVTISFKSSPANPMTTSKSKSVPISEMVTDGRGITTAYAGFGGLWPGSYTVSASQGSSCRSGHFVLGSSNTYALVSRDNPQPTIRFLYVSQENETSLPLGDSVSFVMAAMTCDLPWPAHCLHPTVHLNNLGPERNGSRFLENGSWVQYTPFWESVERTATSSFTIDEKSFPVLEGTVGVAKYYVNDINSLPFQAQKNAVVWDKQEYKLRLQYQFEDSGPEIKGYYKTLAGLVDDLAPDIDLTGPLSVGATLAMAYDNWNGWIGYNVESTSFETKSLEVGGICDLGNNCLVAEKLKPIIENAVKTAISTMLSQDSVRDYVASKMESMVNTCASNSSCATAGSPPVLLDGAFVTNVKTQGGVLYVKWVPTHLYSAPAAAPYKDARIHTISCPSSKQCCEPAPEGGCMKMCISKKQVCP